MVARSCEPQARLDLVAAVWNFTLSELSLSLPRRHFLLFAQATALAATLVLSGCSSIKSPDAREYETVEADPRRDTKTAEHHHQKALKIIDRASNPAYYECECVAGTLCNLHKAQEHLQKALVADVRYGPAHNTLGMLYYYDHKLYLAAWEFEYASRLMPERPEPLNNLGMVYEAAERLDRAIDYYEEAVGIAPTNPVYIGNLAKAHLRHGTELADVQGMLQDLILLDSRPEWVAWARDLLGKNPQLNDPSSIESGAEGFPAGESMPTPAEPIPLPSQSGPAEPLTPVGDVGHLPVGQDLAPLTREDMPPGPHLE